MREILHTWKEYCETMYKADSDGSQRNKTNEIRNNKEVKEALEPLLEEVEAAN